MNHSDLIIVGAGSAGCMLAYRLAARFGVRVALIEPPAAEAPGIDRVRPSRWLNLIGSTEDWGLRTTNNEQLASRRLHWPRGRGLGGSSRINAMIWLPPHARDLEGLSLASGGRLPQAELQDALEGVEATVQPEIQPWLSDASLQFLEAMKGRSDFTPMSYRRLNRCGRRWLPSQLLGSNQERIRVVRGSVDRLIWDHHKARGVRIAAEGEGTDLFASKGVVLCAGAVATPTILLRSGVGPRVELTRHDIDVRVDAPAIGNHLRDHLIMPVVFEKVPSSPAFRANASVRDLARWMTMGSGPVASNLAECGGLTRDQTVQVHVTPTHYLTYPNQDATPAMTIGVNLTQPQSSGHIRLGTKSPLESPVITPNYLDQPADLDGTIRAVHLAREIAQRMPLSESLRAELVPGSQRLDDEQIARSIRRYAQTLYHPVGTCRMGRETDAPIDGDFALREADQLWVADASILPGLTVGNPNAMVMTLAWIAAERIACQL